MWKDLMKVALIVIFGCLLFLFGIYSLIDLYEKEIHQKGGLKGATERIWEGSKQN